MAAFFSETCFLLGDYEVFDIEDIVAFGKRLGGLLCIRDFFMTFTFLISTSSVEICS